MLPMLLRSSRGEQSACEEKKRGQEEYRNDDGADEHGREKPGE